MAIASKGLSLDDFLEQPEKKPALEYEEGMVTQKVSPKGKHSVLQAEVTGLFNGFARPRRLARAFPELRSTYAGRSYVPDVSVYRWERIPRDEAGKVANDFLDPPDIAVEIASPRQSVNELVRRCLWYVSNGVPVALLIDPADESVLFFPSQGKPEPLRGTDLIRLDDVLPGFELTAGELFDSLL